MFANMGWWRIGKNNFLLTSENFYLYVHVYHRIGFYYATLYMQNKSNNCAGHPVVH